MSLDNIINEMMCYGFEKSTGLICGIPQHIYYSWMDQLKEIRDKDKYKSLTYERSIEDKYKYMFETKPIDMKYNEFEQICDMIFDYIEENNGKVPEWVKCDWMTIKIEDIRYRWGED